MWPLLAGLYLVGLGGIDNFSLIAIVELVLFTFFINFFVNGINDIYDIDSDSNNENKDNWLEGIVLKKEEVAFVRRWAISFAILFLFISFFSLNIEHVFLSFFFIATQLLYSNKPPRLKEVPILDFIIGGPILFLFPALIAFSLTNSILSITWRLVFLVLPFMAFHLIAALRDEDSDKKAGIYTTAVWLGKSTTVFWAAIFVIVTLYFIIPLQNLFLDFVLGAQALYLLVFLLSKNNKLLKGFLYLFSASCLFIAFCYVYKYYNVYFAVSLLLLPPIGVLEKQWNKSNND
jgi:4-hydroxybenzoate polyprenyltransferase